MVTGLFLGVLVAGLAFAYRERGRGHLHKLEEKIVTAPRQDAPVPRPGGQEAVVLTRSRLSGGTAPEFLSVTMLPGRGMNVLQITAYVPDKGDVGLLDSLSVEQAQAQMSGTGDDANGRASLTMGSPLEAPWAGKMWGSPADDHITCVWRGKTITLPALGPGTVADGGLLLARGADSVATAAMPDGGQSEATFSAQDFGAHWPSKTDLRVTVLLTGRSIELMMTARNTGDVPEPVGIGWHPRFAILGDRSQIKLRLPGEMRIVANRQTGEPTGELAAVAGTPYDFTDHNGVRLGNMQLDDTFVRLHQDFLDNGPIAEIRDPSSNLGLRLTTLTSTIKAMHVFTKAGTKYLSIDPQYNFDDPFGREWSKTDDTGMVVLDPGQTTQWRVRLELFALTGEPSPF